ncbi:MAG: hypothetical protein L6R36_000895 [Xanthoria steineri]|nr:MAG: hypothetical protein L6R36_000895 [Xanthoria steineri]
MSTTERVADKLEKPALDDRSYRVIRLPNQLEALLVHDPDTDKASASVNVNVGSFSDADDMPGMAHAVEHLLFMGTEKYPVENDYNQYLSAHSGYSNAYTSSTETNYYFEVAASSSQDADASTNGSVDSPLHGALDRFAQFFIAPLFLSSTLDRELKAVDSENKKNLQSDTWRLNQLKKSLSSPKHPYHHFSTGNLQTLRDEPTKRGVNIRDEFIKFHHQNYSANRMKLVVLGREELDELEAWVGSLFAGVVNKDLPRNRWDDVEPFSDKELLTQVFAKPVMDSRLLDIYFPYQDEEAMYETQPSRYLSHLIGHEGPGSILAHIKAKGWANGLSAGVAPVCPGSAFFTVSIKLTEDGLKRYQEIVEIVFQYISLIKQHKPQQWIVDEMKGMTEVDFKFRQKSPATSFTSKLSSIMQQPLPRDWLLSGISVIRRFDSQGITKALSYLRADNYRLTLVSQKFPGDWDQQEKWYGTEYRVEAIPSEFQAAVRKAANSTAADLTSELHLPHKNEFIPTKLTVDKRDVTEPAKNPMLIRNDEAVRTWWKKDDRFWVPKANAYITLRNPLAKATPETAVKANLYCEMVKDALEEYSYDAEIAGLEYQLSSYSTGIDIDIGGYSDKLAVLLEKVLVSMRDLEVKPDRFDIIKERVLRGLRNWDFQQPYRQVGEFTRWLGSEKGWLNEQYLAEVEPLRAEDISAFYPQLLRQMHIECLAHGNIHKEDALHITDLVESTLRPRTLPKSQWQIRRNLLLPPGSDFTYRHILGDKANVNHCIEYYLYVGSLADHVLRAKLLLLGQMTEEVGFDQLRTKEQLGYIVFTGAKFAATIMGYRVIIQSEKPTSYLEERVNAFLSLFASRLDSMTQEAFEGHKKSLINKRLEKVKNLDQESERFWTQISSEHFSFVQNEMDVANVKPVTKQDMVDFFNHYIHPTSPARAKLSVHMIAQSTPKPATGDEKKPSPAEQKDHLVAVLGEYFTSLSISTDQDQLTKRFERVDLTGRALIPSILTALSTYMREDAKVPEEQSAAIVEQGQKMMGSVLPELGIEILVDEEDLPSAPTVKETVFIEDVFAYKSGLALSQGPVPVTPLSEFEEKDVAVVDGDGNENGRSESKL